MLPLLAAPALAGFVLRLAGTRPLAVALLVLLALYVSRRHSRRSATSPDLRAFDPPLIDRIARRRHMVLVEISPHRDMDAIPWRSPTTPFDVHFEGLLPRSPASASTAR